MEKLTTPGKHKNKRSWSWEGDAFKIGIHFDIVEKLNNCESFAPLNFWVNIIHNDLRVPIKPYRDRLVSVDIMDRDGRILKSKYGINTYQSYQLGRVVYGVGNDNVALFNANIIPILKELSEEVVINGMNNKPKPITLEFPFADYMERSNQMVEKELYSPSKLYQRIYGKTEEMFVASNGNFYVPPQLVKKINESLINGGLFERKDKRYMRVDGQYFPDGKNTIQGFRFYNSNRNQWLFKYYLNEYKRQSNKLDYSGGN